MQSESSVCFEKAKNLATYIVDRYGPEQLGLLKLLSAYPLFRDSASLGEHRRLVGYRQMLSFEKVLRETKNTYYGRSTDAGGGIWFTVHTPTEHRKYRDDAFGSVARFVVDEIAALYPELRSFKRGPVVQLGHGVDVDDAISSIDHDLVEKLLSDLGSDYADSKAEFNNYSTALVNEDGLVKYQLYDFLSDLFTKLRKDDVVVEGTGEPIEFAADGEKFDVLCGVVRKSLKFAAPAKATMKTMLEEAHPDGVWVGNDFILYHPFDPFTVIGSTRAATEPVVQNTGTAAAVSAPSSVLLKREEAGCGDDLGDAIRLVDKYVDLDINTLNPTEKVYALYGTERGESIWNKISKIKKSMVMRNMPNTPLSPEEWIRTMAEFLGKNSRSDDQRDLYLLAAGRTLASKGQIEFCASTWQKK